MIGLPRTRLARLSFAALAFLVLPTLGVGQPLPPPAPPTPAAPPDAPPPGTGPDVVVLPVNKRSDGQIKAAHEYIAAKDWDNAVKLLQRVLDEPQDSLLESEVKDAQGKPTVHRTSARAEAERLVAALPKQGLTTYRVKFGGLAMIALGKARANPLLLDEVVRRYFLTDAGAEALTEMGLAELDHGRVEEAADRFRRLLARPDMDELPPLTLFQAALAFHAANDLARENQAVQVLGRRLGPAGMSIGGQALTLDDLRREIGRWPTTVAASGDWPLFRGDARRTGRADGDLPLMEPRGDPIPVPAYDEATQRLAPITGQPPVIGPSLPGFLPLAVGGKVIYRGPDGLHALDAETGRKVWRHITPMCLDVVLKDEQKKWHIRNWLEKYRGLPSLLDEDAMLGALSSDGRRVYFVEDLPIPPHPTDVVGVDAPAQPGQPVLKHWFSTAEEHLFHNRLRSVDVLTGQFRWEIGAWDKVNQHNPMKDFDGFLGPPLPVGRRLFVLAERHEEVVLLCLDPETGGLVWSQDLAQAPLSLGADPARRMQPAQLAYADGVLICPTNVGAIVAVDPLSHNLLWANVYRDRANSPGDVPTPNFDPAAYEAEWKGCAPVIHGDRVVVTAPDGDSVRCLSLRDGSLLWNALRADEDLYVAGVFGDPHPKPSPPAGGGQGEGEKVLIVGKKSCRALSLDKGEDSWPQPVETGEPSGLGAASGNRYLLPLRDGRIFILDVTNPVASTQIEGQPGQALGNLVFHGGDLWSQSPRAVAAYPQLGKGLERADARVATNPKDPLARIDRGRLLYTKGEAGRAVEDWLAALDANPPAELADQTRERLFNALTQLLQQDFVANEKYMAQYAALCRRPPPPAATVEQAQIFRAEERRRLLNLLALTANGREGQGRPDLALQAYRELYDSAVPNELMTAPDDQAVRVRPDLWVQGRIADLARTATPEQRKALQKQIDQDWTAAQSPGDPAGLARFVGLYGAVPGPLGAAGRAARLMLAEHWLDERNGGHALDAERHLHYLRRQTDSPEIAARAQFAYARLLTRHGLLADALEAYRDLARDFPAVAVHDGKTGAALLDDLAVDKRFVAYLDDPFAARAPGRAKVVELQETHAQNAQVYPCEPADGEAPPSCRTLRFTIDAASLTLQAASTDGSSTPWSAPLPVPVAYLKQTFLDAGYPITYQASDHFLVVAVGPVVVCVDRIERRARWVRSLLTGALPPGTTVMPGGTDGSVWVQAPDGRPNQRLGLLGPVGPDGVVVQTRDGVASLDVSTGELRWLRADSAGMLEAFGDDRRLFLVQEHTSGDIRAIRAIRTSDGLSTPIPDCVDRYRQRLRILGSCLLSSAPGPNDELKLRFYDVPTGKDLWNGVFPPKSVVLESAVPELTAVAAPDGTVTIVDLSAQKELARLKVDKAHLDQLVRGMLLRDRTNYYVALQGPPSALVVNDPSVNFNGSMRTTEVNGMIYAFDRASGDVQWHTRAEAQVLLLDHFEESPVLLLTALQQRPIPGNPNGQQIQVACTRSIDKKTGKLLYRKEASTNIDQYFSMEIDVRSGTVDLINSTTRLRHMLSEK